MMYGQMTAGSWIYIGSQGIVQGTYETYAAIADKHFPEKSGSENPPLGGRGAGTLKGTLTVTAGLGGMGGAQPLAITMNEGVALIAEVEEWRIDKRIETKYLDEKIDKVRFKKSYHTEIRQLVESEKLQSYFNPVTSKFKGILKVYDEWNNLEK